MAGTHSCDWLRWPNWRSHSGHVQAGTQWSLAALQCHQTYENQTCLVVSTNVDAHTTTTLNSATSGSRVRSMRRQLRAVTKTDVEVTIREVINPDDPGLVAFGRLQRAVYFEPDALIPGEWLGRMIAGRTGSRDNFVLLAEGDGHVLGGTVFHYLRQAGSGFSSFMGVAREARGQHIARRLHEARWTTLERAANNQAQGVFIDVVNPTRLTPRELEREHKVGSDPWVRRRVFAHLGFGQVDIRYEQPVGGHGGGPVTNLDLLFYAPDAPKIVSTALVVNTMRAYWQPWLGPERAAQHARELKERAEGRLELPLISPEP